MTCSVAWHSFGALLLHDMRYGLGFAAPRLAILAAATGIACFVFVAQASVEHIALPSFSWADYLAAAIGGIGEYRSDTGREFEIPAGWLCICALICHTSLGYETRDLRGVGGLLVAAAQSRRSWWLSKCIWAATCGLVSWLTLLATSLLWTLATGGNLAENPLALSDSAASLLRITSNTSLVAETTPDLLGFVLCAPFACAALSLLQLAISLAVAPLAGFATVLALLLTSAFALNPALLGNHLMLARCSEVYIDGVEPLSGVLLSMLVSLLAMALGGMSFKHRDILGEGAHA